MKKVFAVLLFALMAVIAIAAPKPSDIENALANGDTLGAKSMIAEVLREHPESARAHLLNAYILIHADHNKVASNAELQTAVGLDHKGDVRSSPLFGRTAAEIDMTKAQIMHQSARIAHSEPDFFILWLLGCGVLLAIVFGYAFSISTRREETVYVRYGSNGNGPASNGMNPASPTPGGFYPAAHTTVYQTGPAAQSSGMGAMGTAASVAGGVVAGELLSQALFHNHSRRDYDRDESSYSSAPAAPAYEPSPVSYANERSSFDSSSSGGDSWGSSDSSSSGGGDW